MADTWTTKTALPEARYQHGGASIGTDKGYISGGSAGADHHKEYSQSGDSWAAKTSMPASMATLPGSTSIGSDKLYVTGAMNNISNYEYSQSSNSWSTRTGSSNWSTGGSGVGDVLCTIGGDKMYGRKGSAHEEYSQSGDSWASKALPPNSRSHPGGFTLDSDKYYAVAGRTGGTNYADNYEYSQSGNSWATKTSKGEATTAPGGAAVNGKGYIAGGDHATLNTAIKTTEEYDQSANAWTTRADMPGKRSQMSAVTIGSYKGYVFGGYTPYDSYSNNYEYTAADPAVYDALEDLESFLDAEYPTGLEYLKAELNALGWSLDDLMADARAQAYTALEDLKTEVSGNAWSHEDLKAQLEGYAQALESLRAEVTTSNLGFEGLRCELKTQDTQGPYVFNYPTPAPGLTGVPVNTNVTLTIRDDGWGVDIDSVWVEVDSVRYEKGDAGFSYSGTPGEYVITIDPTTDFEYNRSVSVKAFATDLAGNPGLNQG